MVAEVSSGWIPLLRRVLGSLGVAFATLCVVGVAIALWFGALVLAGLLSLLVGLGVASAVALVVRTTRWRARAALTGVAFLLAAVAIIRPCPPGPSAGVVNRYLPGFERSDLWFAAIPERELVAIGAGLLTTPAEHTSAVASGQLAAVYERIDGRAASSGNRTLDSWLFDRGHYWFARPEGDGPFPLLVFLHGNGGNFRFYPEALVEPLVSAGIAVALPTFGFGHWRGPAAWKRLQAVVDDCVARGGVSLDRVFLGGLSAGAMAATRWTAVFPERFRGCAAISGVPLGEFPTDERIAGMRFLICHGVNDERVPVARVREAVAALKSVGVEVTSQEISAGHFLLLTHREVVVSRLVDWMAWRR